jgi:hypothetical protein
MTTNKRIMVMLPPDLEQLLYDLRKTDEYCRMSYSEILRTLFARGAKEALGKNKTA